ncbi:putative ATP-dependent RNA helicase SoYb isoform X2 [Teleopsis dalmanni]|uniref:putative ATP-dependent RNA helicase SoYb isoform X2 n=1 Tax=Teleopsis dalmanni TaxID=139649 RepID=UPI0018CF3496|nr:putative ATP-dependent RNA helicase SoYb isoform X2 [Teleopsis dalmanni]
MNQQFQLPSQMTSKTDHGHVSAKKLSRGGKLALIIKHEEQSNKNGKVYSDIKSSRHNSSINRITQPNINNTNIETNELKKLNIKIEVIENLHRYCNENQDLDEVERIKELIIKRTKIVKKQRERDSLRHAKIENRYFEEKTDIVNVIEHSIQSESRNNKNIDKEDCIEYSSLKSQNNEDTDVNEISSNSSINSCQNQDASSTISRVPDKLCSNISQESTTEYVSKESYNCSVQNQQNLKVSTRELPFSSTPVQSIQITEVLKNTNDAHHTSFKIFDHLVLAHSKFPVKSIEKLEYISFMEEILNGIKELGLKKILRIQSYAWPHLLRGNSSLIISGAGSGKTFCYIPAICNSVAFRIINKGVKNNSGPIAIIMLSKAEEIEIVIYVCEFLLQKCGIKSRCVDAYGVRNLLETKMKLINGCPILVGTPSSLRLILEENKTVPLIDGARVKHFVMDDIDVMLDTKKDFLDVKKNLLKLCNKKELQIVATSRVWKTLFLQYLQTFTDALLIIGDFLEAAMYNHTKINLKICGAINKIERITKFLEDNSYESQRSIVICNCTEEVKRVQDALLANKICCLAYDLESDFLILKKNIFLKSCPPVLICTDDILHEMPELQNVVNLVHYSMPSSWTRFTRRFLLMLRNVRNILADDFICKSRESLPKTASLVLLDEENELQLPRLFNYINKHATNQADDMAQIQKMIAEIVETRRATKALCPFMLNTETCDQPRCDYRHKFMDSEIVRDSVVPTTGELRITILKVISPTHYIAQLNELRPISTSEWNVIHQSDMAGPFQSKLTLHYNMQTRLKVKWPITINDICVTDLSDVFYRVQVTHLPNIKNKNIFTNISVTVKFLDIGIVSTVQSTSLFICEDEFINFPPQAIDIRLLGVQPHNDERFWHRDITKFVTNVLITNRVKTDKVFAKINFSSTNCIWVDSVYVQEYLETTRTWIIKENLKKCLVANNFVMTIPENQSDIRAIALQCGLIKEKATEVSVAEVKEMELINTADIKQEQNLQDNKYKDISTVKEDIETQVHSNNTQQELLSNNSVYNNFGLKDALSESKCTEKQHFEANINEKAINEYDHSLVDEDKESPLVHRETWVAAPLNTLIQVEYADELNSFLPDIYVQLYDVASNTQFKSVVNLTKSHVEMLKENSEYVFPKKLLCPKENCIIKNDNIYMRAKYYESFEDENFEIIHTFFLCDYGGFLKISEEKLYDDFLFETTETITNYAPFQAIHCNLAGLQYKENAQNYLELSAVYLFVYPVRENKNQVFGLNSYDILLYETDTLKNTQALNLYNAKLVIDGNAIWDDGAEDFIKIKPIFCKVYSISFENETHTEDTRDYDKLLKIIKNIDLSDNLETNGNALSSDDCLKDNSETNGNALSSDDCLKDNSETNENALSSDDCLKDKPETNGNALKSDNSLKKNLKTKKNELTSDDCLKKKFKTKKNVLRSVDYVNHKRNDQYFQDCNNQQTFLSTLTTGNVKNLSYTESQVETETDIEGMPQLKFSYVAPTTYWYETDHRICLKISAFDIESYQLRVTQKTLIYFALANGKRYSLILNFLGLINAKSFTQKLRGQYLYVHLLKCVFMQWPRILEQNIKYNWFLKDIDKINIEYDDTEEEQYLESFQEDSPYYSAEEDEEFNPTMASKNKLDDDYDDPLLDI